MPLYSLYKNIHPNLPNKVFFEARQGQNLVNNMKARILNL